MAVYTKISKAEINNFFKNYEIGKITNFFGIKEGIENTNYLVQTEKNKFILTIYEKRINILFDRYELYLIFLILKFVSVSLKIYLFVT